jgi:hypothetical protein
MVKKDITTIVRAISSRSVPGGGFSEQPRSSYRVDATAWAILALKAAGTYSHLVESAKSRLASEQQDDGRVSLTQDQPQTSWPTALALMAWHGDESFSENRNRAMGFLIKTGGIIFKREPDAPYALDSSIRGWSWIENTFSWVEPTVLSILAFNLSGQGTHERVSDGVRMLLDRQLPGGGWNFGSTIIYGQASYPQIESTGMTLAALAGKMSKKDVERSLDYLKLQVASCHTPLSLGWALFGLGAWQQRPPEARRWLGDCLSRQNKYGAYGTTLLSLILLAYEAKGGFLETIS